jgi:hypothetical protein
MANVKKCAICDHRPAARGGKYCYICASQMEADRRRIKRVPFRFATYRGSSIAFFKRGDGGLDYLPIKRKPENLPKGITLDLNTYIHGFEREQVHKIKTAILQCANAG